MVKKFAVKVPMVLIAVLAIGAIFTSIASAECGPGFSNKQQLIHYYQHNPSAAQGFRKELLAHSAYTGYQADETVINWLRSPEQKVFNAPAGYHLTANTFCPTGEGQYQPFHGLLNNMGGKPMLWHCDKEGNNCVPILKGYCMNFVMGPPVKKHHPPKQHPHHPCKCHPKHKKPHKNCRAQGKINVNGNCVKQVNTAEQECSVKGSNWHWVTVTQKCEIIQINNNCGNTVVIEGSNNTVVQEGNCNVTVEKPCECKPPCECKSPAEPPVVHLETIQEFEVNETSLVCAHVSAPEGDKLTVTFEAEYGHFANSGKGTLQPGSNRYCDTYQAPSEVPPNACKCDMIEVLVQDNTTGKNATDKKEAPIIAETPF